jgi:hypothetical protein
MMNSNTVVYAWKRSVPGREHMSAAHFEEFTQYLAGLQQDGFIQSFEPVLLDPNGSGMAGFFLIRMGDAGVGQLIDRADFGEHVVRSTIHVEEPMLGHGVSGAAVAVRMAQWMANIPA